MEHNSCKPAPTAEVINWYKNAVAETMTMTDEDMQLDAINRTEVAAEDYDWSNIVFTDEQTGKKGVRDVEGNTLIPALYDDFPAVGTYRLFHTRPHVAMRDGKYGIVLADGTGKPLTPFIYSYLCWDWFSPLFVARIDPDSERCGLIFPNGLVVVPFCITQLYQPHNNILCYDSGEKKGLVDLNSLTATQPVFDAIDLDPESDLITVTLNGTEGVLTADNLTFVPMSEYDEDNGRYLHVQLDF